MGFVPKQYKHYADEAAKWTGMKEQSASDSVVWNRTDVSASNDKIDEPGGTTYTREFIATADPV